MLRAIYRATPTVLALATVKLERGRQRGGLFRAQEFRIANAAAGDYGRSAVSVAYFRRQISTRRRPLEDRGVSGFSGAAREGFVLEEEADSEIEDGVDDLLGLDRRARKDRCRSGSGCDASLMARIPDCRVGSRMVREMIRWPDRASEAVSH